jgi:putative transcriptional regulator
MESLRGKLLIASPGLTDFFRRTVVLLIAHGEEGALGVVLNRPSDTTVEEAVPGLSQFVEDGECIWIGGPVRQHGVIALGDFADHEDSASIIVDDIGVVDPDVTMPALRDIRVFVGHAGWEPGQLEEELERDAWIVQPIQANDPFTDGDLWSEALSRMGGGYALLARMPEDPSLN